MPNSSAQQVCMCPAERPSLQPRAKPEQRLRAQDTIASLSVRYAGYHTFPGPNRCRTSVVFLRRNGAVVDLNLDNLKTEILDYLNASEFALFRSIPGALDELPIIEWDSESVPDYRTFLDAARKSKREIIFFSARDFDEDEVAEATEELESLELPREERRDDERR